MNIHFQRFDVGLDLLLDRMEQLADTDHPHINSDAYDTILNKMANKADEGFTTDELNG